MWTKAREDDQEGRQGAGQTLAKEGCLPPHALLSQHVWHIVHEHAKCFLHQRLESEQYTPPHLHGRAPCCHLEPFHLPSPVQKAHPEAKRRAGETHLRDIVSLRVQAKAGVA